MRAWLLALVSALGLCLGASAQADPPVGRVLSVKIGGEGEATRVVVESDTPLKYHVFVLAAGGADPAPSMKTLTPVRGSGY